MSYNVIIILSLTVRIVPGALGRPVGVVLKHLALDARSLTEPMVSDNEALRDDWEGVFCRVAEDVANLNAAAEPNSATPLNIPGSIGELFDKITILEIKASTIPRSYVMLCLSWLFFVRLNHNVIRSVLSSGAKCNPRRH